jgi:hypothetical protein
MKIARYDQSKVLEIYKDFIKENPEGVKKDFIKYAVEKDKQGIAKRTFYNIINKLGLTFADFKISPKGILVRDAYKKLIKKNKYIEKADVYLYLKNQGENLTKTQVYHQLNLLDLMPYKRRTSISQDLISTTPVNLKSYKQKKALEPTQDLKPIKTPPTQAQIDKAIMSAKIDMASYAKQYTNMILG